MGVFLSAEWRDLLFFNYEVDRTELEPLAPPGTVLDTYRGVAYLTLVGWHCANSRVRGKCASSPLGHTQLDLRFYVRRFDGTDWQRGFVSLRGLLPPEALGTAGAFSSPDRFRGQPTRHQLALEAGERTISVEWEDGGIWNRMLGRAAGLGRTPNPGTLEEFVTEHHWAYASDEAGGTREYRLDRRPWAVWRATESALECPDAALFAEGWTKALSPRPASALMASGSEVSVHEGQPMLPG